MPYPINRRPYGGARKPPYYSEVRTPLLYPLSYFVIVAFLAYAMGIQVVSPFDGQPITGLSALPLNITPDNFSAKASPADVIKLALDASNPPGFKGSTHVVTSGFNTVQPAPGSISLTPDGTLNITLMNILPTPTTVDNVEVTNSNTGKKCSNVAISPAAANAYIVEATGCDVGGSAGVIAYDVKVGYTVYLNSMSTTHSTGGQIRLW